MFTPKADPIIATRDYRGIKVIFTKAKWEEKNIDHPELLGEKFIRQVEKTIEEPDEVWQDYGSVTNKTYDKRCYYKKYSANSYAKVVIWVKSHPMNVVTAFEIDWVKETKYTNVRRLL